MLRVSRHSRLSAWLVVALIIDTGIMPSQAAGTTLDSLAIAVLPQHPREFLYTDKGGAHFFGEAAGPWSRSYHGFYSHMHEFVDGWDLRGEDGGAWSVERARVQPDRLERVYTAARMPQARLRETIWLLDHDANGGAALLVHWVLEGTWEVPELADIPVPPPPRATLTVVPRLDFRFLWEETAPQYDVRWEPDTGVLLAASHAHRERTPDRDWPVWAAFAFSAPARWHEAPARETVTYPKGQARQAMARATLFRPGSFQLELGDDRLEADGGVWMAVALGDTPEQTRQRALASLQHRSARITSRRARLQALVDRPGWSSTDARVDAAVAWCRLSLDALVMRQRGLGIYAGFPWFTTYWGRDTFIVLPGACLVTGQFDVARRILADFAEHQLADERDPRVGRLPNFVTVDQVQYATADGTWWWVRALQRYEAASGDVAFGDSLYPVVRRALEGALAHRVDARGFLRHGDGETWMDAGGEAHPYSPRGDRAVEVQALFGNALAYGIALARRNHERGDALRWQEAHARLAAAFAHDFFDPRSHTPYDHLDRDGRPDTQVRPNGLLAWYAAPHLFEPARARATLAQVRERLTFPWGVGSLDPDDPQWHPRHLDLAHYPFDAAYHNGDVWLWLSGPLCSGLVAQHQVESAWAQTRFLVDEILERGVAGSLREIRDAVESPGKDEFGGACAQAWSLAEMQRVLHEDYLGVHPHLDRGYVEIAPLLPGNLSEVEATVPAGRQGWLALRVRRGEGNQHTAVRVIALESPLEVRILHTAEDGRRTGAVLQLAPGDRREHVFAGDRLDGRPVPPEQRWTATPLPPRERRPAPSRHP